MWTRASVSVRGPRHPERSRPRPALFASRLPPTAYRPRTRSSPPSRGTRAATRMPALRAARNYPASCSYSSSGNSRSGSRGQAILRCRRAGWPPWETALLVQRSSASVSGSGTGSVSAQRRAPRVGGQRERPRIATPATPILRPALSASRLPPTAHEHAHPHARAARVPLPACRPCGRHAIPDNLSSAIVAGAELKGNAVALPGGCSQQLGRGGARGDTFR